MYRCYRPDTLWLIPIDESKLEHLEGEEMDGYDTNEFGVARYFGGKGKQRKVRGRLVKPQCAQDLKSWTTEERFDNDELDEEKRAAGI